MARILVSGGAGFIGSHLVDTLLERGDEVLVLDNLHTGRRNNLEKHFSNPNFEFVRHDVTFPFYAEVDQVYHLACPASPVHYQENPVKTVKTNVMGTIHMLGLAKRVGANLLLASTSEVYGDPLEHPQKESYFGNVNTVGPRSCYDEGKRVAETLAYNYRVDNNVNTTIIRIFNTYGPRMLFNDGRVVSNFIVQALKGNDITIYGDGTQTRSFCYVSDLVTGIIKALEKEEFYGPVNLGNPTEMTVSALAEMIIDFTNSKSKIVYLPLPKDDPTRRKPDISLAVKQLNWEPVVDVQEGLQLTIKEFEQRLRGAK